MIWQVIREARRTTAVDAQEVIKYQRIIHFLANKRAPTLNHFNLSDHLVELRQNDRVRALAASSASSALQEAHIVRVYADSVTRVRSYTLTFANGHTRERVSRREIYTLGLKVDDVVMVDHEGAWRCAPIKAVCTDATTGVRTYDIEIQSKDKTPLAIRTKVSINDLRTLVIPTCNVDIKVGAPVMVNVDGSGRTSAHVRVVNKDSTGAVIGYDVELESDKSTRQILLANERRTPHGGRIAI